MASSTIARGGFTPHHRHDRTMIALVVFAVWLGAMKQMTVHAA